MKLERNRNQTTGSVIAMFFFLILLGTVSMSVLFSRVIVYSTAEFEHVHSLMESTQTKPNSTSGESSSSGVQTTSSGNTTEKRSAFQMEAEEEIFKLSYDETGNVTVIGTGENDDKLIAPGTSNIYQFTLFNPGNTALDYTMTMEAYVTGTDLKIPVNVRVWDYTNKYLLGSTDNKVDVMELNTVNEHAGLGAGRYAVYNLEWEWPYEHGDDEYDTMLGNLATDDDLVLHVVIRTVAEYNEKSEVADTGLLRPPNTGDDSQIVLLGLLCVGSFLGLSVMTFSVLKSRRKEKQVEYK